MPNLPAVNRLQDCPGSFRSGLPLPVRLWDCFFKWADFYLFLSGGCNQWIKSCTLEFVANKTPKINVVNTWSHIWHWTKGQHLPASISFAQFVGVWCHQDCGSNPCIGNSRKSWTWWSLWIPYHSEYSMILWLVNHLCHKVVEKMMVCPKRG